jgi:hypothetical protein
METFASGFPENNHAAVAGDMVADECTWDWSDGTRGSGPKADIFAIVAKTWGAMVSHFQYTTPRVIVDGDADKIVMSTQVVLKIDGGMPEAHVVVNDVVFVLGLDENKKIKQWDGIWDNKDPALLAALGAVMAKMQEAAPAAE